MKTNWKKVSYRFSTIVLLGGVCLVLLVGILVWATQDHEEALESGKQPITQPDELAIAVTDDAGDSDANKADTKPNATSADAPLEVPERPDEFFADSQPLVRQTVSEQIVANQTSYDVPEVAPGTLVDEPNTVTELRKSILEGPYGKAPIRQVFENYARRAGPTKRGALLALLVRKSETLPLLQTLLENGTKYDKVKALLFLQRVARWEDASPQVLDLLNNSTTDPDVSLRAAGTAAILGIGGAQQPIIRLLLNSEREDMREVCAQALGYIGEPSAISALLQVLNDPAPRVRTYAAWALAKLGSDAGLGTLLNASESNDWAFRMRAAEALGFLGSEDAKVQLVRMKDDEVKEVGSNVEIALHRIRVRQMAQEERFVELSALLSNEDREVCLWAAERLFEQYGTRAAKPLQERMNRADVFVRSGMEYFLLRMGERDTR